MDNDLPMFLLGAGASADAGLPMSTGLTNLMLDRMAGQRRRGDLQHALNFIVATIVAHDVRLGTATAQDHPDIERVASAVELLAKRGALEAAPFVASWDPALESFEAKSPALPPLFERNLRKALTGRTGNTNSAARAFSSAVHAYVTEALKGRNTSTQAKRLEGALPEPNTRELAKLLGQLVDRYQNAGTRDLFGQLLTALVAELQELLIAPDETAFDYLAPLLRITRSDGHASTIATLNYDLGIETAAARTGLAVARGVERWSATGVLDFPDGLVPLLKLHGSLDWYRKESRTDLTAADLHVGDAQDDMPFLVFGQREKLRAEGPFLQLLEEFRQKLSCSRTLLVIGYAFRDPHINEVIGRWLRGEHDRRIVVVDPNYDPSQQRWHPKPEFREVLAGWQAAEVQEGRVRVAWVQLSTKQFLSTLDARTDFEDLFGLPTTE